MNGQAFFETLNEALESENLTHTWDTLRFHSIGYGETRRYNFDDGSELGLHVSIYRDLAGRYERPVHYHW